MLFPAVLMDIPSSKVCLKEEWSIGSDAKYFDSAARYSVIFVQYCSGNVEYITFQRHNCAK